MRMCIGKGYNLKKAYKVWSEWVVYYLKMKLHTLNNTHWDRFRKEGLMFLHGVDKDYHPLIIFRAFELRPKTWKLEEFNENYLAMLERSASLAD